MGGPQYHLSILRNGIFPCRYFLNVPVDFKIVQCHRSILRKWQCHLSLFFKKFPVDFKDNCDERRVYKSEDISGPNGGTYMCNASP